jgi:hypothetical protein
MIGPDRTVFARISQLTVELEQLREEFAAEPQLYDVYSQSLTHELQLLRERALSILMEADARADLWIRLQGEDFGAGAGPVDIVAGFLTNLKVAAKHAAAALLGVSHSGGRFLKEIEAAVAFDFVATAPGSLKIGLARASAHRSDVPHEDLLGPGAVVDAIIQADDERGALGIRAVKTLMQALDSADDPEALAALRKEVGDHGALRVMYHARTLFTRGVDVLEVHGRVLPRGGSYQARVKERLRAIGEELVLTERYITGVGVVRMLDLDRRTVRLEHVKGDSIADASTVNAEFDDAITGPIAPFMGSLVTFSGLLTFDVMGSPQRIQLDSIQPIESFNAALPQEPMIFPAG